MKSRTRAALLVVFLGLASFPGACYSGGLVGAECADGYTECDGLCVDLKVDPDNCGACRVMCPDGRACYQGLYCEGFEPPTGSGGNSTTGASTTSGEAGAGG